MIISLFVHSDPGYVLERCKESGLPRGARVKFCYDAARQHRIDYEVDRDTGKATPVSIDGRRIET